MGRNEFVLTRRRLVRAGLASLAMPAVIPARAAETLVVNGYGAEFQKIMMDTVIKPFEKKFGVQVTYDATGTASQNYAKIRASGGAPGFDVAGEMTPPEIILGAREKLFAPVTEADVPNLKHVWAKSRTIIPPVGVAYCYQYTSLLWNTKHLQKPESWADYWAPDARLAAKVKAHLVAWEPGNLLSIYALILAAKLKGGGVDNMQPAWDMLKAQKPLIGVSLLASDTVAPYFENDDVWLTPYWSARAGYYVEHKYPVNYTIPKEGTIGLANCSAVPIGIKNKKLAFEFINFRLDPEVQHNFCTAYHCSPGRPDITGWPADFVATQITTEQQMAKVDFPDSAVIGARRGAWTLKWKEIMS